MKIVPILFVLALHCATAFAVENALKLSSEQMQNLGVELDKPETVQYLPLFNAPAQVQVPPEHEYVVSAAQAGLVVKLAAAVGDSVKKGQPLAVIDSPDLVMLQRQYLQAVNAGDLAWTAYQRDKKLTDAGVIAQRRLQESSAQYQTQAAAVAEAKQLLAMAGMTDTEVNRLAATKRLHSQLVAQAPASGIVLERMVSAGARVAMQAPLYRIANLAQLWLEINIPQDHIGSVQVGDRVIVENSPATARITLLGKSIDTQNQTVLGRALIDGRQPLLRPGQLVNAQIIQYSEAPLFKVPNSAIAVNAGHAYVFIRSADGFTVQAVDVAGKQGAVTYVRAAAPSALQAERELAVKGAVALKAKWLGLGEGEE